MKDFKHESSFFILWQYYQQRGYTVTFPCRDNITSNYHLSMSLVQSLPSNHKVPKFSKEQGSDPGVVVCLFLKGHFFVSHM